MIFVPTTTTDIQTFTPAAHARMRGNDIFYPSKGQTGLSLTTIPSGYNNNVGERLKGSVIKIKLTTLASQDTAVSLKLLVKA